MLILLAGVGGLSLLRILLFAVHLSGTLGGRLNTTIWIIGSSCILLSVAVAGARRFGRGGASASIGIRLPRPIDLAIGVPVGIVLYFGTTWLQDLINSHFAWWVSWYKLSETPVDLTRGAWIVVGLIRIFVAPIGEESLFRGFVYRGLRTRYSILTSTGLSAGLFAAAHVNPAVMPAIFIDGTILALALEWRGTLALSMVIHSSVLACFFIESLM